MFLACQRTAGTRLGSQPVSQVDQVSTITLGYNRPAFIVRVSSLRLPWLPLKGLEATGRMAQLNPVGGRSS
jgi:hypothetical protein